ncbi:hypothetical protein THF1C08_130154 [Vibrio jasicida]|uniref:Integrase n=1 Tax=Vibrio jasicida TaxID=766224 RepID=A0AAU9QI37_9VIBR|nr:hypothetical protein THF1C08_130154 [Vibrio jasicida]CAH1573801.1 hypothetical protein THF1A12_120151 [Vibrio jasicida]
MPVNPKAEKLLVIKLYPAKENVLPFKGGRRMKAAEWIPSKLK